MCRIIVGAVLVGSSYSGRFSPEVLARPGGLGRRFMSLSPSQAGPARGRADGHSAERLTHCNGDCDRRRALASARFNCAFRRCTEAATSLSR